MGFDDLYVASTLEELQYRGVKIDPGLTEDEIRAVEEAVGTPLPPELALLLRAGLPTGDDFPDWRHDPEGVMQRARETIASSFDFDIEVGQWWFDSWGARPEDPEAAKKIALEHLASTPPLVPVYSHRFMTTEPREYGNPVLSVVQAVDSIYYGYDLAHYLHREFGVPRPPWSARTPPPVPVWGEFFHLLGNVQDDDEQVVAPAPFGVTRDDDTRQWYASLVIISPHQPEAVSAALNMQSTRVEVDEGGVGQVGEDGEWREVPLYRWCIDSRYPIPSTEDIFDINALETHIIDVLEQVGDSWMELVALSGWPDVDIYLSAKLPLTSAIGESYDPNEDGDLSEHKEGSFELEPEVMASLGQIKARLEVTYE